MLYDYERLLVPLIKDAGKIMTDATGIESGDNMHEKGDPANLVTVYDVAVQKHLISGITAAIPEATFIAEEKQNFVEEAMGEQVFVIDPIDGTANFTRDFKHSCISVGVISRGVTVWGAVYDPYLDELYTARFGEGARLNGRPISVSSHDEAHALILFGTCPYYKDTLGEQTFPILKRLFHRCADLRRCGSAALDLAYIAAGRADGFFELRLSPWDYCAGALLVTEAGGTVTDDRGNSPDGVTPCAIFAGSRAIHKVMLEEADRG